MVKTTRFWPNYPSDLIIPSIIFQEGFSITGVYTVSAIIV
jgi:hypothetical protein